MSSPDDSRPVTLVLDTSAVLAFAGGSMHVHEPILIAEETGEDVAVPAACLLESVRRDPGVNLHELLHHPQVLVVTLDRADDDLLLDWTLYYGGREDLAAAAVLSYRHRRCSVRTGDPDAYAIGGRRPTGSFRSMTPGSP